MIDELALSRQGFEEILSAKNKELEITKVHLKTICIYVFYLSLVTFNILFLVFTGGKRKGKGPKRRGSYTSH